MGAAVASGPRPKVTILILNWNGRDDTVQCLESVARLSYRPLDVIVIDNGSVDDSVAFLRARYPALTLIANGANLGFCEGNNIGIRAALAADADYVMLLNNDATLAPDAVTHLVAAGEADPAVGIVGPKTYVMSRANILYSAGLSWFPLRGYSVPTGFGEFDRGQYDRSGERQALAGHAFMIKRRVLEAIGGLDPDYFAYYEELDFCLRARAAGFACRYVAEALCWHKGHGSKAGPLRAYLLHRNRLLFARKNATRGQLAIFLSYFFLYRAPKTVLLHLVKAQFAELGIFLKALLWHLGLFRHNNPLAAQRAPSRRAL